MGKITEKTEMDEIVENMTEHVCDHLCRYPKQEGSSKQLEDICMDCQMGEFACSILNKYNLLNDFEKSQCMHLLKELSKERQKHQ